MKLGKLLVILLTGAVVVSCATTPSPEPVEPSEPTSSVPAVTPATDDGPLAVPMEGREVLMADLRPRDGRPIFLGVANRLRNREDEETAALLHAAEQASRYTRIAAQYRYVSQRSGRSIGYVDDIDAQWDAGLADRLVESMEVLQSWQDNDGTYVLATVDELPAPPPVSTLSVAAAAGTEPSWISQTPVIPGYLVSIGISQRSMRFRDSLDTADQEALKSVLLQAGATVRMIQDAQAVERRGTREMVTSAEEASTVFRRFYVLARHASSDGRYYYSLVVAQEE